MVTYVTLDELMLKAKKAEGHKFSDIDSTNKLTTANSKGELGQLVKEGFFGYESASDADINFTNLGVKLKVTPFKHNKNGSLSAKERLVLNIINYMEEVNTSFEESSFWEKNKKLLLMFYEWKADLNRQDFHIAKSVLFSYPEADLEIIKQDWETIVSKIRSGRAHELSEGDTNYLGACTKGANKNSIRPQPFSEIQAMQRAFSLKPSYMTTLVRRYIKNEELISFTTANDLKGKSLEEFLHSKFEPYIGLTDKEIAHSLEIDSKPTAKNFIPSLVSSLLGIKNTRLTNIEEFAKANIEFKTVRLEPNGKPEQSMSFETIDFHQWTNEAWEESEIRERFYQTKFLFVIFEFKQTKKENPNRELYFKGIKLWNMPVLTIEKEIRELWEEVNTVVNEGIKLEYKTRGDKTVEINNLPKMNFNGVAHIRPKARNGADKVTLPDGQQITKQCYWLNSSYIASVVANNVNE
ncbi:Sau3AI family type II restriction endonuclease [Bacillus cereus group sp. BfR-BA-01379]|uniref:Sau3AI family type II restriction endonuclease n=1 Tax=Bacillus cereus group sp. BfR-BA-01379 TaxID=2920323 RepID=UPI001F58A0E2|nr:Sau3AI family type II restriction endonuclease [Bacillus cereus group sp. BfR-BA-01379]